MKEARKEAASRADLDKKVEELTKDKQNLEQKLVRLQNSKAVEVIKEDFHFFLFFKLKASFCIFQLKALEGKLSGDKEDLVRRATEAEALATEQVAKIAILEASLAKKTDEMENVEHYFEELKKLREYKEVLC